MQKERNKKASCKYSITKGKTQDIKLTFKSQLHLINVYQQLENWNLKCKTQYRSYYSSPYDQKEEILMYKSNNIYIYRSYMW